MIKKDWIKKVKSVHPKSDEQVLQFIYDFRTMQKSEAAEAAIYTQFESGYCYYFAHMLKLAFKRGEVCWAAPYGHMVWVDDDGVPYDISGVDYSDEAFLERSKQIRQIIHDIRRRFWRYLSKKEKIFEKKIQNQGG